MFGLTSLIYVRDYIQGLQSQQSPSACAQDFLGVYDLPEFNGTAGIDENKVVQALSVKLGSSVTDESSPPKTCTNDPLGSLELHQGKSYFQNRIGLDSNGNGSNQTHSLCDFVSTNRSQKTITHSELDFSLSYDRGSELQQVSSTNSQDTAIQATAARAFLKTQPLSQKPSPFLPPALRNNNRPSSSITQRGSKFRRLSPLRESSGNIYHSAEIEQETLVVRKTRDAASSVLQASKPFDKIYQPVVRKRSLKSILSLRSSVAEDYTNIPAFLGRYRTPSSPEIRGAQTNPLYQSQSFSRASSFGSLRHLPQDKGRTLYIGVDNHRILLPPRFNRSSTPTVIYRPTLREELRTPSMTPYAIIGPGHSNKQLIAMSSTASTGTQPISELGSGVVRRGSSDVSIAGSMASDSDLTLVEGSELRSENPARSRLGSFFDELSFNILQLRQLNAVHQHGKDSVSFSDELSFDDLQQVSIAQQLGEDSVPDPMLSMMSTFQAQPSHPRVNGDSSYYEFSSLMSPHRVVAVTSETAFDDESFLDTELVSNVSGDQVRLAQCKQSPCNVLTGHNEAYTYWSPEVIDSLRKEEHVEHTGGVDRQSMLVQELESPISTGRVRTRAQRSVSFAEGPAERTTRRQQFAVYRHSTSLSDPILPSPLISPRLRGPSFSEQFEEHMLTLPMPPVAHSVPFGGRRSSIVSATPSGSRSIITLSSKKSKGFWAKFGDMFKGCFGAA